MCQALSKDSKHLHRDCIAGNINFDHHEILHIISYYKK